MKVQLDISDAALRVTVLTLLKAAGHEIVPSHANVFISDTLESARRMAAEVPTLILSSASMIPEAVALMKQGGFGYVFVPLQPDEIVIMVERAAEYALYKSNDSAPTGLSIPSIMPLKELEQFYILSVLKSCKGNRNQAAHLLGIARNTLWRKLRQYKHHNT